jgi:hypothetical protein
MDGSLNDVLHPSRTDFLKLEERVRKLEKEHKDEEWFYIKTLWRIHRDGSNPQYRNSVAEDIWFDERLDSLWVVAYFGGRVSTKEEE